MIDLVYRKVVQSFIIVVCLLRFDFDGVCIVYI